MLSQPRLTSNADALEVIAEYACGTVSDACALRGSCKGYRRAVDTTVRRLVYEDQPELRTSRDATLRVHRDSDHLDAVRIAFTCDGFPVIARLVVVAFGLERAKDELHEWDACGPRPVACSDVPVREDDPSHRTVTVRSCWAEPLVPPPSLPPQNGLPSPAYTLQRNVTSAYISMAALTDKLCAQLEGPGGVWRRVVYLNVYCSSAEMRQEDGSAAASAVGAERQRRLARVLRAVGPQLVRLSIGVVRTQEVAAAIACCGELQCFHIDHKSLDSAAVCDALIASRVPLVSVAGPFAEQDSLRLLEMLPTITNAELPGLPVGELPAHVKDRMRTLSGQLCGRRFPGLQRVLFSSSWQGPAPHATHVVIYVRPLQVADLAATFPVLQCLHINGTAPEIDVSSIRFPPTLRALTLQCDHSPTFGDDATKLVAHLARAHGPGLAELIVNDHVDITPLTAFASTLTSLGVKPPNGAAPPPSPSAIASLEAAIEQLVNLRAVEVRSLPSVRCFLGGNHKRLRSLTVGFDGVPLTMLAEACPRLVELRVHEDATVVVAPTSAGAWKRVPGLCVDKLFVVWRRVAFHV